MRAKRKDGFADKTCIRGYRGEIFIKYNARQSLRLTQREIMLQTVGDTLFGDQPGHRGGRLRAFMHALTQEEHKIARLRLYEKREGEGIHDNRAVNVS